MAVDWKDDGMRKWREEVVKEQQDCCNTLGKLRWREFEPSHYEHLKRQIGYQLFGVPKEKPCKKLNDGTGYRYDKLKEINKIFDIIKKCTKYNENPNKICVSFLLVFGKTKDSHITVPVIRIQQYDKGLDQNNNVFIDTCGRVYKDWKDYLDNNIVPDCVLCYPTNGVYSAVNGSVEVEFGISPAGRRGAKVLKVLDNAGTALGVVATGALILGLFEPVTMPVVAG